MKKKKVEQVLVRVSKHVKTHNSEKKVMCLLNRGKRDVSVWVHQGFPLKSDATTGGYKAQRDLSLQDPFIGVLVI